MTVDLSLKASNEYWKTQHDPFLGRVINMLGNTEDWLQDDNPELEELVSSIIEGLDKLKKIEIKDERLFISLLSNIHISRALRFMQYLDSKTPGSASKLLIYAEVSSKGSSDYIGLFLNRNLIFERLQLLARIFAPQRIDLVVRALETVEG